MTTRSGRDWFPTGDETEATRALLVELERAEREVRRAEAARARVSAELMRIAVAQTKRGSRMRMAGAGRGGRAADDMPVRSLAAEVALTRGVSRFRARNDLSDAYLLYESYPETAERVDAGVIAAGHAQAIIGSGNRLRDELRGVYERQALALLDTTPAQPVSGFAAECRRIAQQLEPYDREEMAAAERQRRAVFVTPISDHLAELHVIGEAATVRGMEDRRSDIDHTVAWADGGTTTTDNLGALCRHHHVLRHHSPWQVRQLTAGVFEWTSPAGSIHRERPAPAVRFVDSETLAYGTVWADDLLRTETAPF